MIIAGIDPSLNNFGLSKGVYESGQPFNLTHLHLAETSADNKNKKHVRKNSADLERARILYEATTAFISDADLVSIEIPVGSQSARSMASYGICVGIIASISKPIIQVTPSEVKLAGAGTKTATKEDMINWAVSQYPDAPWLYRKVKGVNTLVNKNEHLADSVAAIHAGIQSETFKQLLSFQRRIA